MALQKVSSDNKHGHIIKRWVDYAGGKRYYMKSLWEINYGHYLDFLVAQKKIQSWEYEPHTFWFLKILRGVRSYVPDFRVVELDGSVKWMEVKGYMDARSRTKLKRMKKYFPKENVFLVDRAGMSAIAKWKKFIPGWETAEDK